MPEIKIRRVDFYPDDWLAGVTELDNAERGVYITICALIYARGGPITYDLLKAASLSHGLMLNRCIRRLKMLGKIIENDGRIDQERCEKELRRCGETFEKARRNGAKGNEIRWNGIATRCDVAIANNLQSTINNLQSTKDSFGSKLPISRRVYAKDFERFWEAYPHRGGLADPKKPADDKFALKIKAGVEPETIIGGAERYAEHVDEQRIEPKFVPQAVKWLNQEMWSGFPEFAAQELADQQMRRPEPTLEEIEATRKELERKYG